MKTEPKTMQELHEIRARMSEQEKDWSAQQIIDFYRQEAEKTAKEFGLHLKRRPHRQTRRKAG